MTSHKQRCFTLWVIPAHINGGLESLVIPLSLRDARFMRSYCDASHAKGRLLSRPPWNIYSMNLRIALSMFSVVVILWSLR